MNHPLRVLLGLALVISWMTPSLTAAEPRPNILHIHADDHRADGLRALGTPLLQTPNLDSSGQYGARTGVYTVGGTDRFDWSKRPLRPVNNVTDLALDRDIIAKQLKVAGYATGMFGKWHIGQQKNYQPDKRGFDEAIVSMGQHFDFPTNPKTDYPKGQYLADFLTDKAVDFITRHKDEPFFLYLPHFGVHSPYQAKAELIAKFKSKPGVGDHNHATYAAMIASVDESVGRVMKKLDDLKLADNTVLIFTSDNGGVGGYNQPGGLQRDPGLEGKGKKAKGADKDGGGITDNAPLRSGKGSLYEGGTREPFIVRWPRVTKPGSSCDVPTIHVDIFPTLLEIAAAPQPRQTLDGESLAKLFRDPAAKLQRDAIYQHFPGYLGSGPGLWRTTPVSLIQVGDWKLMEFLEDGRLELYNLSDDIGETKNLAKENPAKAKELHARLAAWRAEVHAPMPTKNEADTSKPRAKGKGKKKGT